MARVTLLWDPHKLREGHTQKSYVSISQREGDGGRLLGRDSNGNSPKGQEWGRPKLNDSERTDQSKTVPPGISGLVTRITQSDALNSSPETSLGIYADGAPRWKRHNPRYLRPIREQLSYCAKCDSHAKQAMLQG